jgi:hypothetical protein
MLIEKAGLNEVLFDTYPFFGGAQSSRIPATLQTTSGPGILATPIPPEEYDQWLHTILDESPGDFSKYSMKLCDSVAKLCNITKQNVVQTHLIHTSSGYQLREPTNAEIEMMSNLYISNGSKMLMYYCYNSSGNYTDDYYHRGLTELDLTPRISNVYKENKWQKIIDINTKIRIWEPYLTQLMIHILNLLIVEYQRKEQI